MTIEDKELQALRFIYSPAFRNEISNLYMEWTNKQVSEDEYFNSLQIVARENNEVTGCAFLIIVDDPVWNRRWGLVENVYIKKSHRNKGVAKRIMRELELTAVGWGCEFIKLTSSEDKKEAHKLYESLGYDKGYSFKKRLGVEWQRNQ